MQSPNPVIARGAITAIYGPVAAGKTSRLIHELHREMLSAKFGHGHLSSIVLLKPVVDTRFGSSTSTSTHPSPIDGKGVVSMDAISVERLRDALVDPRVRRASVIGIDEGQFFPDLVPVVLEWSRLGKRVYVSALTSTWEGEMFMDGERTCNPLALIPHAQHRIFIDAICGRCGAWEKPAIYSKYLGVAGELPKGEILIGGTEVYLPTCADCYHS